MKQPPKNTSRKRLLPYDERHEGRLHRHHRNVE
jgi:hypothetical protein